MLDDYHEVEAVVLLEVKAPEERKEILGAELLWKRPTLSNIKQRIQTNEWICIIEESKSFRKNIRGDGRR